MKGVNNSIIIGYQVKLIEVKNGSSQVVEISRVKPSRLSAATTYGQAAASEAVILTAAQKEDKKERLHKKLRQIQLLKEKDKSKLDKDELTKLSIEGSVLEEIAQLEE